MAAKGYEVIAVDKAQGPGQGQRAEIGRHAAAVGHDVVRPTRAG